MTAETSGHDLPNEDTLDPVAVQVTAFAALTSLIHHGVYLLTPDELAVMNRISYNALLRGDASGEIIAAMGADGLVTVYPRA